MGCRGGEGCDWVVLVSLGVVFLWYVEGGVFGLCWESRLVVFVGIEWSVGVEVGSGFVLRGVGSCFGLVCGKFG